MEFTKAAEAAMGKDKTTDLIGQRWDDSIKLYDISTNTELESLLDDRTLSSSITSLEFYSPPLSSFPLDLISSNDEGNVSIHDTDPFILLKMVKEATLVGFGLDGERFWMGMGERVSVHQVKDAKLIWEFECKKRVLCTAADELADCITYDVVRKLETIRVIEPCEYTVSRSICMDESMPVCESQKNSDIVFVDAKDVAGLKSSESMVSCHKHKMYEDDINPFAAFSKKESLTSPKRSAAGNYASYDPVSSPYSRYSDTSYPELISSASFSFPLCLTSPRAAVLLQSPLFHSPSPCNSPASSLISCPFFFTASHHHASAALISSPWPSGVATTVSGIDREIGMGQGSAAAVGRDGGWFGSIGVTKVWWPIDCLGDSWTGLVFDEG
ncbi:hypothetical protein Droror1_Dr00023966 [Drosera rotundifolia]